MREDIEAREFDEAVMNDKEPTVMPKDYCVECGSFECECKKAYEDDCRREEANRELSNQLLASKEE